MTKVQVYPSTGFDQVVNLGLPEVLDVTAALRGALAVERGPASACVRTTLLVRYAAGVTEQPLLAHYKQVWVVDHWETVCCFRTTFLVAFPARSVVVDVDESMRVL